EAVGLHPQPKATALTERTAPRGAQKPAGAVDRGSVVSVSGLCFFATNSIAWQARTQRVRVMESRSLDPSRTGSFCASRRILGDPARKTTFLGGVDFASPCYAIQILMQSKNRFPQSAEQLTALRSRRVFLRRFVLVANLMDDSSWARMDEFLGLELTQPPSHNP